MNKFIDDGMIKLIDGMSENAFQISDSFVSVAKMLAATFCMIYFAIEAYKMLSGDARVQIMPLLKPFALSLIILGWGSFVKIIDVPLRAIQDTGRYSIDAQITYIQDIYEEREMLLDSVHNATMTASAEVQQAMMNQSQSELNEAGVDANFIVRGIAKATSWMMGKIKLLIFEIFERILLFIWQTAYYFILIYAILYKIVLIIIGPISFSLSILPWFNTTWIYWVSHYIKASLYGVMAQIVFLISTLVQTYNLKIDSAILNEVVSDPSLTGILAYSSGSLSTTIFTFPIALLIGILGMFCVPTMVNWVVQVGTSSLGDGIKSGVKTVASVITKI